MPSRRFFRSEQLYLCTAFLLMGSMFAAAQDVLTFHNDMSRSGVQQNEVTLNPSNVSAGSFGKTLFFPVNGDVYAQPLFVSQYVMADGNVHDVLFVATQTDIVYAFDAEGKNPPAGYLWKATLLPTGETYVSSKDVNSSDITPNVGITGTPVIDRQGGTLFVVTKSKTVSGTPVFNQRLHALNLADGSEKLNGPILIQATLPGNGGSSSTTVSFDPLKNNQRAALLLAPTPGGLTPRSVFIAWASHGDNLPYHGWIISYDATSDISKQTGVWTDSANGTAGGIWMSGSGMASDGNGNFFAASGNGTFDANTGGVDLGDSLIKLTNGPNGLAASDWFTPLSQATLNTGDRDFGTGGPVLLPSQNGPVQSLMVTADKTGRIYLLNTNNLGRFTSGANKDVQDFSDGGHSVHSNLVFFNNALYFAPDQGPLESWLFNPNSGTFTSTPTSRSAQTFNCSAAGCDGGGSNFTISANGAANGIVWAVSYTAFGSGPAILYAFDAANVANLLYSSAQAANSRDQGPIGVKFTSPTVANGVVYVAGRNGVMGYSLFNAATQIAPSPVFSVQGGTYSVAQTVALTDAAPGAIIYYTLDGTAPTINSTVYTAPLTIKSTTVVRAIAIAQNFVTSPQATTTYVINSGPGGGNGSVGYGLGFYSPSLYLNGSAKYNGSRLRLTDGAANETASAYFPAQLNVQSFNSDFNFQLTKAVADGFTFVIQSSSPFAVGASTSGAALGYGPDNSTRAPGIPSSVAIKFDIFNNAGEGASSTGVYTNGAMPTLPSTDLSSSSILLASGDVLHAHLLYNGSTLTVTISDTKTGAGATQSYAIDIPGTIGATQAYVGFTAASIDGVATQEILNWTFVPQPYYQTAMSTFDLAMNGGASLSGNALRLTDSANHESRSAFFTAQMNIQSFKSAFDFQILNPIADGLTFTIQRAGVTSVGGSGGGLGFSGIKNSVCIKFDLYSNSGEGPDSTGLYANGVTPNVPAIDLSGTGINLHSGDTFHVQLSYDGSTLAVVITDKVTQASASESYSVNIPTVIGGNTAYVGFTGSTGGAGSIQQILDWTFTN